MAKIKLPASLDGAVAELNGVGELLRATEWRKAAIVASFVRPEESGGRPSKGAAGGPFLNVKQFAALGIIGLRKPETVRLYVNNWLEANNGKYPLPGESVTLPTDDWPPGRTGTDGYESEDGAARTIDRLIEKHGVGVIADTVARRPDVAEGFAGHEAAVSAVVDADYSHAEQRAHERRGSGHSPTGSLADAAQKVMLQLGAIALDGVTKDMWNAVSKRVAEGMVFRPGEREQVFQVIDTSVQRLMDIKDLLTGVSDEDLASFLAEEKGDR